MTLHEKALQIASSQIGVQESGHNRGVQVNAYLKSIGLGPGYPWCMAFVYWCYRQAATEMGVQNWLIKTGGVMHQWNEQQPGKKIVLNKALLNSSIIKPGAIFIMDFGAGKGHTGIVEKVYGGFVDTIEGNTNNDGSREGIAVMRRTRKLTTIKGFIQ